MDDPLPPLEDRLAATLLGTALGDALGLPAEGLATATIERRFGAIDRFHLIGRTGFVSDDTEQSALVAQSLVAHPADPAAMERAFGRALVGWFLRLPWGIGFATLRASIRRMIGFRPSGVNSAGNGAAMRAAVVGVFFRDDADRRRRFGQALARTTHTDPRAVEGALYVAELAALASSSVPTADRVGLVDSARTVVDEPSLASAIVLARDLAGAGIPTHSAAQRLGSTGFVVHTVGLATFCFVAHGSDPHRPIVEAIRAGGDADTIGAIVGGWVGALHGTAALRQDLIGSIHDGPFGPTHLRELARAMADVRAGRPATVPAYSVLGALARNLVLYPVVLAHGLRRLLPF